MITGISIKNFKSVVDLSLDLGRFNVLIGENGSGKSNILEGIAFGAAAAADKLDYEFLGSRGLRLAAPEFMRSAFDPGSDSTIEIMFLSEKAPIKRHRFLLKPDLDNSRKWINVAKDVYGKQMVDELTEIAGKSHHERLQLMSEKFPSINNPEAFTKVMADVERVLDQNNLSDSKRDFFVSLWEALLGMAYTEPTIEKFIIYSPEQSTLRRYEESAQIYPLGIKGEGLFQYLRELHASDKHSNILSEIKECLLLLDWYDDFDFPDPSISHDVALAIRDKYIDSDLKFFDQRSTNEGFLFLLFYFTLFHSKETPAFFAIDNIDTSLNPKLCSRLIRTLAEIAEAKDKQVILTTQNPSVLDGLQLSDESQRLFVVRRNDEGHTRADRVQYKSESKMKLSELWANGYIGGLPVNF